MSSTSQDDLGRIQRQIHEKKTGILDSTRRMLGLVNESETVGASTAAELYEQREKLENIEKRCDSINENLKDAQRNLNKLGSIFGGVKNYFNPPKSSFPKSSSQSQIATDKKKTASYQAAAAAATTTQLKSNRDDTDTYTYLGKSRREMDDLERETEDGLHDVHQGVTRLKLLAMQMNDELEGQKPLTDRLGGKIDALKDNVDKKNKDMRVMLSR